MFDRLKNFFKPKDDIIRSVEDLQELLKDQPRIKILEISKLPDIPELRIYVSPEEQRRIQLDCLKRRGK